jgi:hypothetical protein
LQDKGFVETWGRSLQQEWAAFQHRYYYVVGGLICCWDDGIVNGNLGANQWGVVDSKRQPKPVHYYIRKVFAPIKVELASPSIADGKLTASVKVSNSYNFINLDGFKFDWELEKADQTVATARADYRVEPMTNFFFPLSMNAASGADHLRVSVQDADGYSIQEEEFPLPVPAATASVDDLLKKIGVSESKPLNLKQGANRVQVGSISAAWDAKPSIHIADHAGREIITLSGFAMQAEKSSWTSMEIRPVTYQPPTTQHNSVVIPFSVTGNTKDKKIPWRVPGTITVAFGEASMRVAYTLEPASAVSIPEAGFKLKLDGQLARLSWSRDALSATSPKNWAEGYLEKNIPFSTLQTTGSKRRVYWITLTGDRATVLLVPLEPTTNLRPGGTDGEIVVSDFLASGNFLGKFDKETSEKKLTAGEKFKGGFTLYFLNQEQRTRLQNLSDAEMDLTWERRVRAQTAVQ